MFCKLSCLTLLYYSQGKDRDMNRVWRWLIMNWYIKGEYWLGEDYEKPIWLGGECSLGSTRDMRQFSISVKRNNPDVLVGAVVTLASYGVNGDKIETISGEFTFDDEAGDVCGIRFVLMKAGAVKVKLS